MRCVSDHQSRRIDSTISLSQSQYSIQAICSTHKHHDHTGRNKELVAKCKTIHQIYGRAVERVPHCRDFLVNGQHIVLPKFGTNEMSELVGIEARGSMEYRFSSKATPEEAEYLLTGDTMFSDGGGVPFEADTGQETEAQVNKSNGNTFVRDSIGRAATERCFAEILSRPLPHVPGHDIIDKILIFPGWTRIYQRTLGETISNDHVGFLSLEELSSTRIFRDGLANVPVRCIASTNLAAQYWQTRHGLPQGIVHRHCLCNSRLCIFSIARLSRDGLSRPRVAETCPLPEAIRRVKL